MSQVKGLCVLDVDGTLILEEVIDLLGREAGHEAEISQITSRAMRGELVFESSLRKRVSLLEGLPILVFDNVFNSIHLSLNVPEFISILQKNGILVGLVSGGFTPIVGEGRLDSQSFAGKAPIGVAKRTPVGVPVIAICGSLAEDLPPLPFENIQAVFSILEKSEPLEDSLKNASLYLERTAANIGHLLNMCKI